LGDSVHHHDVEQLVAVVEPALRVHHLQTIGVAVQGNAIVGAMIPNGLLQSLR
jgi:hypothetical protein